MKVSSTFYIEECLKPLLEVEIPKLYPGEEHKVFVHHDKATSHTSRQTEACAAELESKLGIKIIRKSLIPVNKRTKGHESVLLISLTVFFMAPF